MRKPVFQFLGGMFLAATTFGPANAVTLSTGAGDGSLNIDVSAGGGAGNQGEGLSDYDPVGPLGAASTVYESFIAISDFTGGGVGYTRLGDYVSSFSSTSATQAVSSFAIGAINFTLTQLVSQNTDFATGAVTGATLTQSLSMTNTSADAVSFSIRRYLDGDLGFDGSIQDAGGIISLGGSRVLFETDSLPGQGGGDEGGGEGEFDVAQIVEQDVQPTFVGINSFGGTTPETGSYEISSYSGLRTKVLGGDPLNDSVEFDDDNDGFADTAYDITLALQNNFTIGGGATSSYVSQTIFGNSVPPAPGATEEFPLLPGAIGGPAGNSYVFELPAGSIAERQIVFIDPVIATGYTYTVSGGADFFAVQLPSFGAVADTDYVVTFDGIDYFATSGEVVIFAAHTATPIYSFTITGIDESLMLDPDNALAFVTGIGLLNIGTGTQTITQTPIETFVPDAAIPIPAPFALLLSGLVLAFGVSRRRAA